MKSLFKQLLVIGFCASLAFANSQTKTASTATGGTGWNNPTLAEVTDQTYATNTITNNTFTTDLCLSNYGFTLPGATVNGISVAILGHTTSNGAVDLGTTQAGSAVQITKVAGTRAGTVHTNTTNWTSTDTTFTLGSSSDLWGLTWASSDINSSGFGVCVSMENNAAAGGNTAQVDSVIITVTFTPGISNFLLMFSGLFNPDAFSVRSRQYFISGNNRIPVVLDGVKVQMDMPVLMGKSLRNFRDTGVSEPFSIAQSQGLHNVGVAASSRAIPESMRQGSFPGFFGLHDDYPFLVIDQKKRKRFLHTGDLFTV